MTLDHTHPLALASLTDQHEAQLLASLAALDLTARDRQLVTWLAGWDQPTVHALADLLARLSAVAPAAATPERRQDSPLRNVSGRDGSVTPPEPPCGAWNDAHDCRLPLDHHGDHHCAGCGDVWNRGPGDHAAEDWEHQRTDPDARCISRTTEQIGSVR